MRIDWYTKAVLTAIAVLLGAIALRPYVSPEAVAHAQVIATVTGTSFAGLQFTGPNTDSFFDPKTGELWQYYDDGTLARKLQLTKIGEPMTVAKK